jgi:hypothetical protein
VGKSFTYHLALHGHGKPIIGDGIIFFVPTNAKENLKRG